MTQKQFQLQYDDYVNYMKRVNVHVFTLDIRPLHPWITRTLDIDCSDWKPTAKHTTDIYGNKFEIWEIAGHRFINNHIKDIIPFAPGQKVKVKGCNSPYNREPHKIIDESFYNQNGDLIFYVDEEQKTHLTRQYTENCVSARHWDEYRKVEKNINDKTWTLINETVAMDLLESLPPVRMKSGAFLFGEASHQNTANDYCYKHCVKYKGKWYCKYSTVDDFDRPVKIDCD